MNEKDLRVIKTRQTIENTFLEMLEKMPLEKVTVTSLAKKAQISPGTFYLHYENIDDLRNKLIKSYFTDLVASIDFFPLIASDPELFIKKILDKWKENRKYSHVLMRDLSLRTVFPYLIPSLQERIYNTCPITPSPENNLRIEAAFYSTMLICINHDPSTSEAVRAILVELTRNMLNGLKS